MGPVPLPRSRRLWESREAETPNTRVELNRTGNQGGNQELLVHRAVRRGEAAPSQGPQTALVPGPAGPGRPAACSAAVPAAPAAAPVPAAVWPVRAGVFCREGGTTEPSQVAGAEGIPGDKGIWGTKGSWLKKASPMAPPAPKEAPGPTPAAGSQHPCALFRGTENVPGDG